MKKILMIEDEVQNREIFLECLRAEGFEAIGAENGLVGVQQVQAHLPDLVLCDIVMPQLDGYGVFSALKQNSATALIPFIFLTAKGAKAEIRKGMEMGADDYLTKPSTAEELLGAIAARLEKQAAMQQWCAAKSQLESDNSRLESPSIFPSNSQLSQVFEFIEANYCQAIGLNQVAQAMGYSPAYLTDLVKRLTGKPVNRWIVQRRMTEACSLLLTTNQSIEQIAAAIGYQNTGHFFRQFRQYHGTTPQAWRNAQGR